MSPTDTILASTIIITTTTIVRNAKNKKFRFQTIVSGFLLTLALLIISVMAPNFAKGLAYLGLVGAFAVNGPAIFSLIGDLTK